MDPLEELRKLAAESQRQFVAENGSMDRAFRDGTFGKWIEEQADATRAEPGNADQPDRPTGT